MGHACSSKIKELNSLSLCSSIVRLAIVVDVKVSLEPLHEFKVVLILSFHELRNLNMSLNSILLKSLLQNFEIVDEFELMFRCKVYFSNSYSSGINSVKNLTVYCPGRTLLNFSQLKI